MPQVIIPSDVPSLDGSVRSQAYAFIDKLRRDDTLPGLHIEPMELAADRRARTGRVNQYWRAVLIKLTGSDAEPRYIYLGTFPHDEANAYARSVIFQRNPRSGSAEVVRVDTAAPDQTHPADAPATGPATTVAEKSPAAAPLLPQHGIAFEDLVDLGVTTHVAHEAMQATSQDRLLEIALEAPSTYQTDVLLMLGDGTSLDHVRATHSVTPVAAATAQDTDDDLIGALDHPAARMQFTYLVDDEDLRAAIEDENFARWRVFLHPAQRSYAEASTNGAFRLSGGAGTGKTVVLLHRAHHLHRAEPDARIVLTTFNRTLATSLRHGLQSLDRTIRLAKNPGDPGIYVGTVDAVSWRIITHADTWGLDTHSAASAVIGRTRADVRATDHDAWDAALQQAGESLPESLRSRDFLSAEYESVVVPGKVTERDQYLRVRRHGRGVPLARAQRRAVWDVIEAYRDVTERAGTTDYDEKAMIAATALDAAAAAGRRRIADHVLVDEAQDLTPARLMLLRALVAQGPDDLYLAEDSQQRIYAPRTVLSRYGIHVVGRSRRLRLNYRTTAQNLDYATGILAGQEFVDLENDAVDGAPLRSARSGPSPRIIGCPTRDDAYDAAADQIRTWLADGAAPETIAVLVRSANEATALADEFTRYDLPTRYVGAKATPGDGRVSTMTMHRSKGMEFRHVLVFGVTAELARSVERLPDGDRPDALQRERSLLYVATTRARDRLTIVWDGAASDLLPQYSSRTGPAHSTGGTAVVPHHAATKLDHAALAREVHDTVGHSLAEIALRVSALEVKAETDPAVREELASVRAAARRAGVELREVLASMRTGADGDNAASFDDLHTLVTSLRNKGARIVSNVSVSDGHTADGALARTCYRIVQESVTNALKHAGGLPIDILLRGAPTTGVTLIVQNPLPDGASEASVPGSGSGIDGMAHRAAELGGVLSAGPVAGRFVVDARLPWRLGD